MDYEDWMFENNAREILEAAIHQALIAQPPAPRRDEFSFHTEWGARCRMYEDRMKWTAQTSAKLVVEQLKSRALLTSATRIESSRRDG